MAILKSDKTAALCGVTVNEYLLTKHNPNRIDMPSGSMEGKIIGVTIYNTDWSPQQAEQLWRSDTPVPLLMAI